MTHFQGHKIKAAVPFERKAEFELTKRCCLFIILLIYEAVVSFHTRVDEE